MLKGKKGKLWKGVIILAVLIILYPILTVVLQTSEASLRNNGQFIKVRETGYEELSKAESFREEPSIANYSRVVLITGDVVHLYTLSDGSSRVAIEPADPRNANRAFRVFEGMDELYVIPNDISLDKFDIELFNVKLLARQMSITGSNDTLRVIIRPARDVTLDQFIGFVSSISKEVKADHDAKIIHKSLNLASLNIDVRQPEKVKALFDKVMTTRIEKVWLDRVLTIDVSQFKPMLDISVSQIGADWVWVNSMMSGEGVKIAILDTGIDLSHRDFTYFNGTSKIIAAKSFVSWPVEEINNPWDYHGHGTHVSGIAAGTGLTEFANPEILSPIAHPLIMRPIVHSGWNDEAAIIAGNGTHLMVVWHSDVSGNWEIWFMIYDGISWSPPTKLTENYAHDIYPYVTLLSNNRILVAWSSNRTGGWEIWYKTFIAGSWTQDLRLTNSSDYYDYSPAFVQLNDDTIAMLWSSNELGSNTTNVMFVKLMMQSDGTLKFIEGSERQLTSAEPNMWLYASSILVASDGELWAFWTDLSRFDFNTNWGGVTTMYYNFSADSGNTWSGDILYSCSGCVKPYGIQLRNGTIVVFYQGDDFERNVMDTIYYLRLGAGGWEGPFWLPSDEWHRWWPSAAYGPGGLYVAFTSPGRPWEYYGNDIYITTPKPRYIGVAPKANLLEGKVLNRWGWGYESWIIEGIEWAVERGADIISMSLGGWPTDGTDPLSQAVDWAFDQGVLVVVAAGNWGKYFGITTPGAARKALTVGAVDDNDEIAWFSSRGPTLDYRVKPEIVAPGVNICSSVPRYLFGTSYLCWSGTSMATPHVAGAAALAEQFGRKYFGMDELPSALKNALIVGATDDLGYNIYEQGAGRLDIKKLIAQSSIFGYGGIFIRPEIINFGPVAKGAEASSEIVIEEFRRYRTLYFELEVRDVLSGEVRNIAHTNVTTIVVGPGERKAVKLTISPLAPTGLYSGKIKITDNYTQTYNVIFSLAILNRLEIHKTPVEGPGHESAVAGDMAYVFILDPDSELEYRMGRRLNFFDNNGNTYLLLPDGTYEVTTAGEYSHKSVFLAYDNLTLTTNYSIGLDERDSFEVAFNPAKSGQVFAEVYHSIRSKLICPSTIPFCYRHGLISVEYYPAHTSVYYSYSETMLSIDRYVYYPLEDVNPSDPRIISTDIWHDLVYVENKINSARTRVADYNQLVNKYTEYRTAATFRQSATRIIWAGPVSVALEWHMNVPYSRLELISPNTWYSGFYRKWADMPGLSTPYWEYYGALRTEGPGSETVEVWGEQPLFPTVRFVFSFPVDGDRIDIWLGAETFTDSNVWYRYRFHSRYPLDSIDFKVFRDGVEIPINYSFIYYWEWGDYYLALLGQQPPAHYTLKTTAYEYQSLSTMTIQEYDFRLNADGSISRAPVITNIDVKDLTLNNTVERPKVDIEFQLWNETSIQQVTLEYSINGGTTWLEAPVNIAGPNTYTASFTIYGQQYVSIRINATDANNLKTSIGTINGFLVKGALTLADFPAPFIVNGELRNAYIVIGDVEPHGAFGIKAYVTDAADAVILGYYLGRASIRGNVEVVIDSQIARYNYVTNIVEILDTEHNLITFASAQVNMITWYYFTDYVAAYSGFGRESPSPVHFYRPWVPEGQPVRTWIKFPDEPLIYSDWDEEYYPSGAPKSAYGLIALYYDATNDRYVLCVSGISTSHGNRAALLVLIAKLTGEQLPFDLKGVAMLVKWYDSNGNEKVELSEISLVKSWP